MYRFYFLKDSDEEEDNILEKPRVVEWVPCQEVHPEPVVIDEDDEEDVTTTFPINDTCEIKHLSNDSVVRGVDKSNYNILVVDKKRTDLLTAMYEGGLKVWECTYDLAKCITNEKLDFNNKKVLDLGCGAGVIGIYAFINGSFTYFQDYNFDVIKSATIRNVMLNTSEERKIENCRFYSGDWLSFLEVTEDDFQKEENKFDYIFTAETIYNPDNHTKLYEIFKNMLKKSGVIYLAAKVHYFAIGGNIYDFAKLLQSEDLFTVETVLRIEENVAREVLKIQCKS